MSRTLAGAALARRMLLLQVRTPQRAAAEHLLPRLDARIARLLELERAFARELSRSLELGGYPLKSAAGRRFAASNAVGDDVLLVARSEPPMREETGW